MSAFDRALEIGAFGYNGVGFSVEAIADESRGDFEWIELLPNYRLKGAFFIRDYANDGYGNYTSAQILGSVGNLEFIGGFFRYQFVAGAHISKLDGGYEFVDLVGGLRVSADYTFFLDRSWASFDGAFLTEGNLLVAWMEFRAYPIERLGIGCRLDYDGDLDTWGDAPFLDDYWENGLNLSLSATWRFEL